MTHEIRSFRTVLATAGLLSFAFSYFFDFGIYLRLGISFSQAPTGAVDHLHGWVAWLPFALPLCLAALAGVLAAGPKAPDLPEAEAPGSAASPSLRGRVERAVIYVAGPGVAGCAAYLGYEAMRPFTVAMVLAYFWAYCWVHVANSRFRHHGESGRLLARLALAGVPSVMIIAAGMGWQYADFRAQDGEPGHLVDMLAARDGNAAPQGEEVRIVRSFEQWTLVLEEGDVVWLNVNDGTKLRQLGCKEPLERLLCVFGAQ